MILQKKKYIIFVASVACLGILICIGIAVYRGGNKQVTSHSYTSSSAWKFADYVKEDTLYPVVRVIDGDTLVVHVPDDADPAGHDLTIRLIGADTPEVVDPRKFVQCFGPEASAKAKEMLASTSVYLEKDPLKGNYDKYGRVLAYVRLFSNGTAFADTVIYNEYMIQAGFAHEYTYFNQPYKYQAQFKADEKAAKKAKLGLWGKCGVDATGDD